MPCMQVLLGVLYTIRTSSCRGRLEAVGDLDLHPTFLVTTHGNLLHEKFSKLTAVVEGFLGVFSTSARFFLRAMSHASVLSATILFSCFWSRSASTEAIRSFRFSTWFLRSAMKTSSSSSSTCPCA